VAKFFELEATYEIAANAEPEELLNDATCLMSLVHDGLNALAMSIEESRSTSIAHQKGFVSLLHGLSYLAQMGTNAADAANAALIKAQEVSHG